MSRRLPIGMALLLLTGCGKPVAAGDTLPRDFSLRSATISLPAERPILPPSAELIMQNCTACHSPEMILSQPVLGAKKWQAEIDKMRATYRASIDLKDDTRLVAALTALQADGPAPR
ncbi:cytochrome C nitrite reductase [Sphingomonas sp. 28-63-12]|uniref:cytochrome C nitrite reductase n=1 Tax=Sphingomonas sp. 28-63-12 TaxID=1970434 RepID=UPI000BD3E69C|nr:MAG: hypothetical protein B7Y47_00080 [Sphingomonas sp. 28-63-12]